MIKNVIVHSKSGKSYHLPGNIDQQHNVIVDGIKSAISNNANVVVYDSSKEIEIPAKDVHSVEFVFK